jgi:hypothetical protein
VYGGQPEAWEVPRQEIEAIGSFAERSELKLTAADVLGNRSGSQLALASITNGQVIID